MNGEYPDEAALTGKFSVGVERPQLQSNKVTINKVKASTPKQ
jgi:hypothetical protein